MSTFNTNKNSFQSSISLIKNDFHAFTSLGLSAKLKELWTATQGSSFDLFLYAAGLRERYLDKKKDQYSPEFRDWYAKHELQQLLGNTLEL